MNVAKDAENLSILTDYGLVQAILRLCETVSHPVLVVCVHVCVIHFVTLFSILANDSPGGKRSRIIEVRSTK